MKTFLIITALYTLNVCICGSLFSQEWNVNPSNYEFSMNIVGKVLISGDTVDNQNSILGAFLGEECIGVASPIFHNLNYQLFYITVYSSNVSGNQINFKFKDADDQISDISNYVLFYNDKIIGTDTDPFIFMDTMLYNSTDFLSYFIPEQVSDAEIRADERTINVVVEFGTNITSLVPEFRLAPGATPFCGEELQVSAQTVHDFTTPVSYVILGADGVNGYWTVSVSIDNSNIDGDNNNLFKLYPQPANNNLILDLAEPSGAIEIISTSGKLVKKQEVYFGRNILDVSQLARGVYFVKLLEPYVIKKIVIN